MSASQTKSEQKPKRYRLFVFGLLLSFLIGFFYEILTQDVASQASTDNGSDQSFPAESLPAASPDLLTPSDSYSPKQVVEIQMQALAAYPNDRASIHQVFAHASPSNQAVTGPIANFEQVILGEKYRALTTSEHYTVGDAVQRGTLATVVTTTVDKQGKMSIYRFYLSEQQETYPGCWMTDAVIEIISNWQPGDDLPATLALPNSI